MAGCSPETRRAAAWIGSARRVVVFTGAGVSAESGIPTFRDEEGFWQRFPPEQFATWGGLTKTALREPARVAEFVIALVEPIAKAAPSRGHAAISELESFLDVKVITQNIDELHQEAGSSTVREIHGTLFDVVSAEGRFLWRVSRRELIDTCERIRCAVSGVLKLPRMLLAARRIMGWSGRRVYRPGIVLFGESLREPDWSHAQLDAGNCDVMLIVGTSARVWPAAEMPVIAREAGAKLIAVDPVEDSGAELWLRGPAGEVLPELIRMVRGD
ncbi:MAG: iron dicitrate transport regulator FecR [Planctomycetota bacterium]|nr:MAG: iron dicitrate transport regulator FecR [Planctomycetota bacterium]